jgi:hypothetical protein
LVLEGSQWVVKEVSDLERKIVDLERKGIYG